MGALYLNKDVNDLADAVFETTLVTHKSICPAAMAFAIALTVRHFIQGNSISNIIAELPDQIEAQENRFIAKETTENRWGMKKSVATDAHSVSMLLRNVLKKVSEINANKSISVDERLWAMRAVVSQEAKLYAETSKAVADDDGTPNTPKDVLAGLTI
jgi:ADP-ribosylglycohydrolase